MLWWWVSAQKLSIEYSQHPYHGRPHFWRCRRGSRGQALVWSLRLGWALVQDHSLGWEWWELVLEERLGLVQQLWITELPILLARQAFLVCSTTHTCGPTITGYGVEMWPWTLQIWTLAKSRFGCASRLEWIAVRGHKDRLSTLDYALKGSMVGAFAPPGGNLPGRCLWAGMETVFFSKLVVGRKGSTVFKESMADPLAPPTSMDTSASTWEKLVLKSWAIWRPWSPEICPRTSMSGACTITLDRHPADISQSWVSWKPSVLGLVTSQQIGLIAGCSPSALSSALAWTWAWPPFFKGFYPWKMSAMSPYCLRRKPLGMPLCGSAAGKASLFERHSHVLWQGRFLTSMIFWSGPAQCTKFANMFSCETLSNDCTAAHQLGKKFAAFHFKTSKSQCWNWTWKIVHFLGRWMSTSAFWMSPRHPISSAHRASSWRWIIMAVLHEWCHRER